MLVDTAVVGHLGTPQLGGLAIAGTLLTTGFWVFNFLAYGTTAAVARLVGAGDRQAAAEQGVQAMWLAATLGVALAALAAIAAPAAISLMGASARVRPHALTYLRVSALGAPAVLVALAGMGFLRGMQRTRPTLVIAVAANAVNLILELVFIYGLGAGITGSAVATVIAQYGAAAAFVAWLRRSVRAAPGPVRLRPTWSAIRATARVGRDLVVRTGSLLTALAVATGVASRLGTPSLGAHQVAYQLWTFLALTVDALAIAGQAMIGRMLGAVDPDSARMAGRRMIQWGALVGIGFAAAVAALRLPLVHLFTADPAVARRAGRVLWLVAVLQPVNAVVFVLDGILIGAGEFAYLARSQVVSLLVFLPAALAVAGLHAGLGWLWAALALWMGSRLALNGARFSGSAWLVTGAHR